MQSSLESAAEAFSGKSQKNRVDSSLSITAESTLSGLFEQLSELRQKQKQLRYEHQGGNNQPQLSQEIEQEGHLLEEEFRGAGFRPWRDELGNLHFFIRVPPRLHGCPIQDIHRFQMYSQVAVKEIQMCIQRLNLRVEELEEELDPKRRHVDFDDEHLGTHAADKAKVIIPKDRLVHYGMMIAEYKEKRLGLNDLLDEKKSDVERLERELRMRERRLRS